MSARTILKHLYKEGRMTSYQYERIDRCLKARQGEWIMDNEHTNNPLLWYKCNLCGVYHSPTNFCPNCGAKMRGGNNDKLQ